MNYNNKYKFMQFKRCQLFRLKELREEMGMSQKALAEKLDMSQSAISFYETGARMPEIVACNKFANYFDVSLDYFTKRSDVRKYIDNTKLTSQEIQLLSNFKKLNSTKKSKVLAYIEGLME